MAHAACISYPGGFVIGQMANAASDGAVRGFTSFGAEIWIGAFVQGPSVPHGAPWPTSQQGLPTLAGEGSPCLRKEDRERSAVPQLRLPCLAEQCAVVPRSFTV